MTYSIECSESIKNHIFYYVDSNYGIQSYIEYESEENCFSWVLRHSNYLMWVFK